MLILFDIDATLISTSRVGMKAMRDAARERFGEAFSVEGIDYAGRLDPLIIADIFRSAGAACDAPAAAHFRGRYAAHLSRYLAHPDTRALALPGVVPLLARLRAMPAVTLGLLTGNFPETGTAKLRACGIDAADFPLAVWADDATATPPTRHELPGVAMARYRALHGHDVPAARVVVIGDTPHDVACARAHGCRALGVATGQYSVEQLRDVGADMVLPDLADTARVTAWLLSGH